MTGVTIFNGNIVFGRRDAEPPCGGDKFLKNPTSNATVFYKTIRIWKN